MACIVSCSLAVDISRPQAPTILPVLTLPPLLSSSHCSTPRRLSLPARPASKDSPLLLLLLLANQSMSHSRRDPSPTLLGMFSPRSSYNNPDDPLTAALLGSIPRDETPAQRQQRLALEAEARRISDEIDERLRQERLERGRKKVVKVLLLGW